MNANETMQHKPLKIVINRGSNSTDELEREDCASGWIKSFICFS